jgi:glycosyltransferase involved in cell wall biosynthesis
MKESEMKPADELISVVICTAGRPKVFGAALQSVLAQDYCGEFEVLILDQSRDDGTETIAQTLAGGDTRVRYWRLEQRGLSRAYNRGVAEARGELVAFTDDDCVAPPGWLRAIADAFAREPETELLYGQVLGPIDPRDERHGEGVIPTLPITKLERLSKRDGFRVFGMGANFATRRRAWESLGGFDEILGGGGPLQSAQDFDYAYRVYRLGGTILLDPSVIVHHYGFRANAEWPETVGSYGIGVGGFYLKHVRAGDVYAGFLLVRSVLKVMARVLKRLVLARPTEVQRRYLAYVAKGMQRSLGFGVDRRLRLYYERSAGPSR